jgi:biopolymer transport protein ExbD
LRSIGKIYLEKRNLMANEKFDQDYFSLPIDKKKVIDQIVPVRVSILEPKITSKQKAESNNRVNSEKKVTVFSVIISGNDKLDLNKIREEAKTAVKNSNGDISANIMSYVKISDEDINSIKEELQKAGIKKISQLKPPPPPPPARIELTLRKDGKVLWGKEEYSVSEVEQKIVALRKEQEQVYKKYNMEPGMITSIKIGNGVTQEQINAFKEALRRAKAMQVNYSFESKEQSTSEKAAAIKPPPPPPPPIFQLAISENSLQLFDKSISESELDDKAKEFLSKVTGSHYYVRVNVKEDVPPERIQKIRERLFFAGMSSKNIKFITEN